MDKKARDLVYYIRFYNIILAWCKEYRPDYLDHEVAEDVAEMIRLATAISRRWRKVFSTQDPRIEKLRDNLNEFTARWSECDRIKDSYSRFRIYAVNGRVWVQCGFEPEGEVPVFN